MFPLQGMNCRIMQGFVIFSGSGVTFAVSYLLAGRNVIEAMEIY
jgi:hypothetical protein